MSEGKIRSVRAKARRMMRDGCADNQQIANTLHMSVFDVKRIRDDWIKQYNRKSGPWTDAETLELRSLIQTGMTYPEIAERLDRKLESVKKKAHTILHGERKRKWTPERKQRVIDMMDSGASARDIAEEFQVTRKAAHTIMTMVRREKGILSPNPHGARQEDPERPPLTDWPKWPGCQCGYCPMFDEVKLNRDGTITGICRSHTRVMNRDDFCTADELPPQRRKYPVEHKGGLAWVTLE